MFGYVRPCKPNMRIREYEAYKAVYCALCKQLGKQYGWTARMALNYDCTFLALLSASLRQSCTGFHKGKCTCNPLKKCNYALGMDESLSFAATATVLLTAQKLQDDIYDSSFLKGMKARFLLLLARRARKKAVAHAPKMSEIINQAIQQQREVENNRENISMDAAADPSAKMLEYIAAEMAENETQKRVLEVLGYQLGRWVYFIDAADDMKKDCKSHSYNPFVIRYRLTEESDEEAFRQARQMANETLNQCVSQVTAAFELLEIQQMKPILQNILEEGLAEIQRTTLFEEEKKHVRSI